MQPRTGEGDLTHTQAHIQATGIMGVDRTRHDTVGVGRLGDGVGAMGICKEVSMVEGGGGQQIPSLWFFRLSSSSPSHTPAPTTPTGESGGGGGRRKKRGCGYYVFCG